MNPRTLLLRCLSTSLLLLAAVSVAPASPSSDPVGAFRIRLRGNSDTLVSLPLQRPALVEAALATRTGSQLTLATDMPALPTEGAYVLVMSGSLEGAVLPATTLSSRTLTIDPGAFDLSLLHTETVNGTSHGDIVALVPYWTLDTVFPAGAGIQISTNRALPKTQILFFDDTVVGTNLSSSAVYFYFSGDGTYNAGWYRVGDMSAARGSMPVPPHRYFIVRHPTGTDTELLLTGAVRMAGYRMPIASLQASRDQDNFLALPVPVPLTLSASRLFESGAFADSPNRALPQDQLLVFDNTLVGQNKSSSGVYFHFAGNGSFAAGWYRVGDMNQTVGNLVLSPGTGYIIRKHGTTTPEIRSWNGIPSYLQ